MTDPNTPTDAPRPIGDALDALPGAREWARRAAALEPAPPYVGRETEEDRAERERAQHAAATAARARRLEQWAQCVPARFTDARLDGLSASQNPDGMVTGFLGSGAPTLVLAGDTGAGKSYAAYAVGHDVVEAGHWVIAGTVGDLVDALREDQGAGGGTVYADLVAADLVILDELGMERGTDFSAEMVQRIVDARWRDARPLIVTTNLKPKEIQDRYGSRVLDRIQDGALIVRLEGESTRAPKEWVSARP